MKKAILVVSALVVLFFILELSLHPTNSFLSDGGFRPNKKLAFFDYRIIKAPNYLPRVKTATAVLGENNSKKRIEIDLTNQRLSAYKDNKKVYEFLVSTGKWGLTPTGNFRIWNKLRYTLMAGGSVALGTYYYLPNVPYTMFFYGDNASKSMGYGIHGTYWHSNFGHPMSHGCINMKTEEAALLFDWANPSLPENSNSVVATDNDLGTQVIIYGEAPKS